MKIVDVNILLYAYDSTSAHHASAKQWWEAQLSNPQPVGLPWNTLLAFLRITTNPRILDAPLSEWQAVDIVNQWLVRPMVSIVQPGSRHWDILKTLIIESQAIANLVPDAHLAALAIEHGATLCSTDRDFRRFPSLSWENPLG